MGVVRRGGAVPPTPACVQRGMAQKWGQPHQWQGLHKGGQVSVGVATETVAGEPVCTPQMGGHAPTGEGARGREGEGGGREGKGREGKGRRLRRK
jgi:hypothetical protein